MPLYSKFLKDMLTKKGKCIHSDNIMVEGNCSVVIQRILPPKYKDPRRASINLMPLSMCRRIGELEILLTRMTLQLADHSVTRP
ncbi:hypothetical protein glysoja_046563, partial [Glycine soja]